MTIIDENTERRIIAAMLTEPHVLAMCDDIETADFNDFRLWILLDAIRTLQSDAKTIGIFEVERLLEKRDVLSGQRIADKVDITFLALLITDYPPYNGAIMLVRYDVSWLRELTSRRRQLEDAA